MSKSAPAATIGSDSHCPIDNSSASKPRKSSGSRANSSINAGIHNPPKRGRSPRRLRWACGQITRERERAPPLQAQSRKAATDAAAVRGSARKSAVARARRRPLRAWLARHEADAAAHGLQHFFERYRALPRHPSQLYAIALEGAGLFLILWLFARKPRPTGAVTALFLAGYG